MSVIVMAYNEVASLGAVVEEILSALRAANTRHEVVIVDDGSSDGTGSVADQLALQHPVVTVIHHPRNLGLGGVYRTGFEVARFDCVTFFPADGQFPASIIQQFLHAIETNDLVLGYLPVRDEVAIAKFLSACERLLYRGLFGPLPKFQGIMMVRRLLLSSLGLRSQGRGWGVLMELIVKVSQGSYRVQSLPTPYRRRIAGKSKVNNLRTVLANVQEMMALYRLL